LKPKTASPVAGLAVDLVRFLAPRLHDYGHAPSSLVAIEVPRFAQLGLEFGVTPLPKTKPAGEERVAPGRPAGMKRGRLS
jgi:hypothetical protein